MLSKKQYEEADEFYVATITDFCNGIELDELEEVLYFYEEVEDYEACMGIKRAIDNLKEIINK